MTKTAVLFDLGDVLVHLRLQRGLDRLRALAGARGLDALELYTGAKAIAYNAGLVEPAVFLADLVPGASFEAAAEAWTDIFEPWPEMEALAAEVIDAGHPVYLLSNTDPLHFEYLRPRMPVLARFTGLHLSYEVKAAKPDPRYFTAALERFALDPSRCVFLDDRAPNVEAARSVGIPARLFAGDVADARAALRAHGVAIR